jgi:hypothetical protein
MVSGQQGWCYTVVACLHVLQVVMAWASDALETCERVLETREPNYRARPVKIFFISKACNPWRAAWRVVALKPTLAYRRGPKPWDTRQRRSPPWLGGEARSNRTRGSAGAHPSKEAWSEATGHGAASEP